MDSNKELAPQQNDMTAATVEAVLLGGDLSKLTSEQRLSYYQAVTKSLGLNPLTKPFDFITLNGKLTLYAKRDCTDQLRALRGISITISDRSTLGDVYVVTARASTPEGRTDESTGAVSIKGLAGEALANGYMKAETKAKRRVTLSIAGLGMLDETEAQDVATMQNGAQVNKATGEVLDKGSVPDFAKDLPAPKATDKQVAFIERNHKAVGLDSEGLWIIIDGIAPEAKTLNDLTQAQANKVIAELKAMHANQVELAKEKAAAEADDAAKSDKEQVTA